MSPLAYDLYCGLGGWTDGLLAEGYRVVGYDIEAHEYDGERYRAELRLQDVLTINGAELADADLIVGSSPCQDYSYMAMPWGRAKAKAAAIRADGTGVLRGELNALFDAQFRIQREASAAAGRHIPLVVENVRGAQEWVGRARASYGSYYLWGDVPALLPRPHDGRKNPGFRFDGSGRSFQTESVDRHVAPDEGRKSKGMNWSDRSIRGQDFTAIAGAQALHADGLKLRDELDGYERDHPNAFGWKKPGTSSKSPARKVASAKIAKIPLNLSRFIARTFKPVAVAA